MRSEYGEPDPLADTQKSRERVELTVDEARRIRDGALVPKRVARFWCPAGQRVAQRE
jgi:hypothetical protein